MTPTVGLIGAGSLAGALAKGWAEPLLCSDVDFGRAKRLADSVGGRACATNVEVAREADVVVLCHKPAQLLEVAREIAGTARSVVSVLGTTPLSEVQEAYPGRPVYRVLPSIAVEVRRGPVVLAAPGEPSGTDEVVRTLFSRLGDLVELDDNALDVAMALMSNTPAYYALIVEAQVDAGIQRGVPAEVASRLVIGAMGATAEVLRRDPHTLRLRQAVTSPGGSTARGLGVLEKRNLRSMFAAAMDAVLDGPGVRLPPLNPGP